MKSVHRRRRVKISGSDFWIIGPEDFIVNKLSGTDREALDEVDVVSVLRNTRLELDISYLHMIADRANVLPLLKAIEKKAREA